MLSAPLGVSLIVLAIVPRLFLPGVAGLVVGFVIAAIGAIVLLVVVYRRAPDVPAIWLPATIAAMPVLFVPVAGHDTVLDLVGHDVVCATRDVVYTPSSGGRTGGGGQNRWTVACPDGPLTFTSSTGLDPSLPAITVRAGPADLLQPRPVPLLTPWWSRVVPLLGGLGLAALLAAASRADRTRHL